VPRDRVSLLQQEEIQIAGGEWIRSTRTARSSNGSKILFGHTYRVRSVHPKEGIVLTNGICLRPDHGYIEYAYSFLQNQLTPNVLGSVVACFDGVKSKKQAGKLLLEAARIARNNVQLVGSQLELIFDFPKKTVVASIDSSSLPLKNREAQSSLGDQAAKALLKLNIKVKHPELNQDIDLP
jgi:hypothetical protein